MTPESDKGVARLSSLSHLSVLIVTFKKNNLTSRSRSKDPGFFLSYDIFPGDRTDFNILFIVQYLHGSTILKMVDVKTNIPPSYNTFHLKPTYIPEGGTHLDR